MKSEGCAEQTVFLPVKTEPAQGHTGIFISAQFLATDVTTATAASFIVMKF